METQIRSSSEAHALRIAVLTVFRVRAQVGCLIALTLAALFRLLFWLDPLGTQNLWSMGERRELLAFWTLCGALHV